MSVSPADVTALTKATDGFLCPLAANEYGIDFLNFTISDYESKKTIFEVGRDNPAPQDVTVDFSSLGEDMYRKIKYTFSEDVLRLPNIQTSLIFSVGPREMRSFRMIERHYFRDQLVKSFDFEFGFCIPSSVNTWDAVYQLPPLSEELITDMINHPFETKSDSFYFVNEKLIMHNKASYQYFREDAAQSKKSYEDKFGGAKGGMGAKAAAKAIAASPLSAASSSSGGASSSGAGAKVTAAAGGAGAGAKAVGGEEAKVAEAKEAAPRAAGAKAASKETWSKESDYN